MTSATAQANPNLAFVKYWGKPVRFTGLSFSSQLRDNNRHRAGLCTERLIDWQSQIHQDSKRPVS